MKTLEIVLSDEDGCVIYSYILGNGIEYFGFKIFTGPSKYQLSYASAGFKTLDEAKEHMARIIKEIEDGNARPYFLSE